MPKKEDKGIRRTKRAVSLRSPKNDFDYSSSEILAGIEGVDDSVFEVREAVDEVNRKLDAMQDAMRLSGMTLNSAKPGKDDEVKVEKAYLVRQVFESNPDLAVRNCIRSFDDAKDFKEIIKKPIIAKYIIFENGLPKSLATKDEIAALFDEEEVF